MVSRYLAAAALIKVLGGTTAWAGSSFDGFRWLSENDEILREGIIWNDRIGDGKDRYKSGGVTQSWVIPESRLFNGALIPGQASYLEIQGRGLVMTPDNVSIGGIHGDRPFAQYASLGAFLRTYSPPVEAGMITTRAVEDRVGLELGLVGDPLPVFEIQELIHNNGGFRFRDGKVLDSEVLLNFEARRTVRWHAELNDTDLEFAPYASISAGMRENSLRVGGDIIYGSSLEGRTWNIDPAVGALIPGGSMRREGSNWLMWLGGDVGAVASDAFLDGGFNGNSASVPREEFLARVRVGFMFEYENVALTYSMTWLSEEFEDQSHSQVIGAIGLKYRF